MRFLRYTGGFAKQEVFNRLITRPLSSGNPEAVATLQRLMSDVCLRRKKDMEFKGTRIIQLPGVDEYLHKIGILYCSVIDQQSSLLRRRRNTLF